MSDTDINTIEEELSGEEMKILLGTKAYFNALELYSNDIIIQTEVEKIRAQIAQLRIFAPVSDTFEKAFNLFIRKKGELFVPVRRGYPQPNVVVDQDQEKPSVIQIVKVLVGGKEKSFGAILKTAFPDQDFDRYDLYGAREGSDIRLDATKVTPTLSIFKDVRGRALAVIARKNT